MVEATDAVREPRFWKITVNPEECPQGAWEICRSTGLAMLGLPGAAAESGYAVRNMKQVREGDWLVAYTPQEGPYSVGGIGRVTRAYECETGPFEHAWNGPVRRSLGVEWCAGACRIADLVKEGRFRKGKIPRVLDEISAEEFACIRERVEAAAGGEISAAAAAAPLAPRPSPVVMDPRQEQPPLPEFFIEWTKEEKILGPDIPAGCATEWQPAAAREAERPALADSESLGTAVEAALGRSREMHLLASFGTPEGAESVLEFGLPTIGEVDAADASLTESMDRAAPSEVRVGAAGWTGVFRREVESGRPCFLLLRGPQYSFLNMTPIGTTLRGLPLFALFAIGAVAAPGKEAFRSGAAFIFRGRRASGDYEVEVRPRRGRPVFREPAELAH